MGNVHAISDFQDAEDEYEAIQNERSYGNLGGVYPGAPAKQAAQRPQIVFRFPAKEMIDVMLVLMGILGARVGLLLAGAGALYLGARAIETANYAPQLIFAITVFIPMVWLSSTRQV